MLKSQLSSKVIQRLPPHGGSGLKSEIMNEVNKRLGSPSTRREWIEITRHWLPAAMSRVSLHTEGVD